MGILNKLLGFRWSLYIVRNENELVYAMHEHSVFRILGYVMGYFKNGAEPVEPWSLYLNFNKKHQMIKLEPKHFTPDGEFFTHELIKEIETIDPGWQVQSGEPVFLEVRTKKQIPIKHEFDPYKLQEYMDNPDKRKGPTYFSIMDEVFGKI